jgi:hypothetical protein
MKKEQYISINIADLSRVGDQMLALLLAQVTKSRQMYNITPKQLFDGMVLVLDCDRKRALAIVEVIRMKYKKNQIRMYDGKKLI